MDIERYDRVIVIRSNDDWLNFTNDPKRFLEESGALEGLEEYNGFKASDGSEITEFSNTNNKTDVRIIAHRGAPWARPWYCTWNLIEP
jgi:hypothetical protein